MPPAVIGELLRAPVDLPAPERLEVLVIRNEDAAGCLALGIAEGCDVDAVRTALDRVRSGKAEKLQVHFACCFR